MSVHRIAALVVGGLLLVGPTGCRHCGCCGPVYGPASCPAPVTGPPAVYTPAPATAPTYVSPGDTTPTYTPTTPQTIPQQGSGTR